MQGPMKMVGARVARVEDPRFLLGKGNYVGDLEMSGMLEIAFLRSPYAHARIRSIDAAAAKAMPGVRAVYTWEDLRAGVTPFRAELDPAKQPTYKACDQTPLAGDKVRFVGEAVAAVVADSRYVAEDALEEIVVEWEPLDPVVDPERALEDRTSLVHEEWGDNVVVEIAFATPGIDERFASAAAVVKDRFRTNRHHALPLEPRGCVARFDEVQGELTLWTSSQMPHLVRTKLADHLRHPENQIRVIAPDVGGGFGLKCHLFPEEVVAAAIARDLRVPVRWLEDRRESFTASFHAKDEIVEGELAVDADGTIRALRIRAISDTGAYSAFPWSSVLEVAHVMWITPGPYRVRDYAATIYGVSTNKPPLSTYRGVGAPTACFVMEGLLDRAAREIGIDPADIRRRNMLRKEEFPYASITGLDYEIGGHHECLEKAIAAVGYEAFRAEQASLRERGIYRGIGLASYVEMTALSSGFWNAGGVQMSAYEAANVKIDPSGHATVFCGTHSHGQAHHTVFAQIASDELGLPMEKITVRLGDTTDTPYGWGTWGSRGAVVGGGAVMGASQAVAAKIKRLAGHKLEVAPEDVELVGGKAQAKGAPTRFITIADLARQSLFSQASWLPPGEAPGLEATHYFEPPPVTFPNATHAAIVEVDVATGALRILRYVVAEDVGNVINPMVLDGQVHGGVAQGLGGALLEHLVYDEGGQLLTGSFMDYLIPTATDVPRIEIEHNVTPSPRTPCGFQGAGEGGAIAPFAVIANAVADALSSFGARVVEVPLHPERIHRLAAGAR
jgi:aerobic carbon-monoxide dehydrogenase large subunit